MTAVDPAGLESVLTLFNGDSFAGQLRTSDSAGVIRWLAADFLDPFDFETEAVKSIRFSSDAQHQPDGTFILQCVDGDLIAGDIRHWDANKVLIDSPSLGLLTIQVEAIANLHRIESGGSSLVRFGTALADWRNTAWGTEGWSEFGESLVSGEAGAVLNGDFGLPAKCIIDVELAWAAVADFVFAVGTNPAAKADASVDGWRLETFDKQLALIREGEDQASLQVVTDLADRTSIRLIAYLDQLAGDLHLFRPDGRRIASVTGQPGTAATSGIRIVNRSSKLQLMRLRVSPWIGESPTGTSSNGVEIGQEGAGLEVGLADGTKVTMPISGFDADSNSLVFKGGGQTNKVALAEIVSAHFGSDHDSGGPPQAVFRLRGGAQLSGSIAGVDLKNWLVQDLKFDAPLHVPQNQVHSVAFASDREIVRRRDLRIGKNFDGHRIGRFESDGRRHLGWITAADDDDRQDPQLGSAESPVRYGLSTIHWQPIASRTASRIGPEVSGRIVYQTNQRLVRNIRSGRAGSTTPTLRRQAGKSFGQLFLDSVDRVEARRARRDQHVVHLHSGDIIACRVETIGESGVYLSTATEDQVLVAHADIKVIEFVTKAPMPEVGAAKRQRLLTIPRLQKSSPPTHLLVSPDGDFLRCRLIRAGEQTIDVEVQMEQVQIPRERVTHIIWLHPDDTERGGAYEGRYQGRVQALWPDGNRVTFVATGSTDSTIQGTSAVLGRCNVNLDKITQLALGNRIGDEAAELVYAKWKLTPAKLPLVMQGAADRDNAPVDFSLVGKPAPPVLLERLDGGAFQLSEHRGQVVVLDFWASWCAPCRQSMPMLQRAIAGFDPKQVILVGINLEERREIVRDTADRWQLDMVIALDQDGATTKDYRASTIPQTVIIDASGRVAQVFGAGDDKTVAAVQRFVAESLSAE